MITVLEAINLSTEYLQKKGIDLPRVNAELLLADLLKCKRLQLYLQFDRPLNKNELNDYRQLIKRRGTFEPLQYIIGWVEFFGNRLKVTPAVLIPRPETEILVETIVNQYKNKKGLKIIDIGCGSGNIGISLSKSLPEAEIYCTDINRETLKLAEGNAKYHKVDSRIEFILNDVLSQPLNFTNDVDIIVSNPPYISKSDFQLLQKEIMQFEPRFALTDEADGYSFFREISLKAENKLKTGGKLFFEISEGQCNSVKNIMTETSFSDIKIIRDYQNIDRVLYGVKK